MLKATIPSNDETISVSLDHESIESESEYHQVPVMIKITQTILQRVAMVGCLVVGKALYNVITQILNPVSVYSVYSVYCRYLK